MSTRSSPTDGVMLTREDVPAHVASLIGRPVRWGSLVGDFDGRERVLLIFDVPGKEQRALMHQLQPHRAELEAAAGGSIMTLLYTPSESIDLT